MDATVVKFGGGSSATPESIDKVVEIIAQSRSQGDTPVVVVSAMGVTRGSKNPKVTDLLLAVSGYVRNGETYSALNTVREIQKRHEEIERHYGILGTTGCLFTDLEKLVNANGSIAGSPITSETAHPARLPWQAVEDLFASYGERLMATDLVAILKRKGIRTVLVDTSVNGGFITDSAYGEASLLPKSLNGEIAASYMRLVSQQENQGAVPIYTGYIARNESGQITTLGRDGSNTTALALGAALRAKKIIMYSDVPGVLAVDDKYVKSPKTISQLSYAEILKLAENGVKVFQPNSLNVLRKRGRLPPIHMRSTYDPEGPETIIINVPSKGHTTVKGMGIVDNMFFRQYPVRSIEQYETILSAAEKYEGITVLRSEFVNDREEMLARLWFRGDSKAAGDYGDDKYFIDSLERHISGQAFGGRTPQGRLRLSYGFLVTAVGEGIGNSSKIVAEFGKVMAETDFPKEVRGLRYRLPVILHRNSIGVVVPWQIAGKVVDDLYHRLIV